MSNYNRYTYVKTPAEIPTYAFTSEGPRGKIKMAVVFSPSFIPHIHVLTLGNLKVDGSIDVLTVNDNSDRNSILATVVDILDEFTKGNPGCTIRFEGSTPQRTRLYRMVISIYYDYLSNLYEIKGEKEKWQYENFRLGQNYISFLIKRKL